MISPSDSELARNCLDLGINVVYEAFAERNYAFDQVTNCLTLVNRRKSYASITDCEEALEHAKDILLSGQVNAVIQDTDGELQKSMIPLKADTICIHSDSKIALELAIRLAEMVKTLS